MFIKIVLISAALTASSMAAAVEKRAISGAVTVELFNSAGQGCVSSGHSGIETFNLTVTSFPNGDKQCQSFNNLAGPPFVVESAWTLSYPAGETCKVDFLGTCDDVQGTPDQGIEHCQSSTNGFGCVCVQCPPY